MERQTNKNKASNWAKQGSSLASSYQVKSKRTGELRASASSGQSSSSMKLEGLRQILDGIVKATYKDPLTTDSDVLKERRM